MKKKTKIIKKIKTKKIQKFLKIIFEHKTNILLKYGYRIKFPPCPNIWVNCLIINTFIFSVSFSHSCKMVTWNMADMFLSKNKYYFNFLNNKFKPN